MMPRHNAQKRWLSLTPHVHRSIQVQAHLEQVAFTGTARRTKGSTGISAAAAAAAAARGGRR